MPQVMDGTPLSMSAAKRIHQFNPRRAVFGEEHAAQHADRHAEQRGLPQQNERADDGVGHAAAGFADGLGQLGEERPVDGAEALA